MRYFKFFLFLTVVTAASFPADSQTASLSLEGAIINENGVEFRYSHNDPIEGTIFMSPDGRKKRCLDTLFRITCSGSWIRDYHIPRQRGDGYSSYSYSQFSLATGHVTQTHGRCIPVEGIEVDGYITDDEYVVWLCSQSSPARVMTKVVRVSTSLWILEKEFTLRNGGWIEVQTRSLH